MNFEIALYPGDGIGPDVLEQAVRVMHLIGERHSLTFQTKTLDWGYEYWKQHGTVVPDGFLDEIRDVDSILLGAVAGGCDSRSCHFVSTRANPAGF